MKLYTITTEELNTMTLADINTIIDTIESDGEMEHAIQNPQFFSEVENAIVTHNLCVLRGLYLLKEAK